MIRSPLLKLIFIISVLFYGIQMNAQVRYTCPDAVNYYCSNDDVIILHDLGNLPSGGTFTRTDLQQTVTQITPSDYPRGAEIPIHYLYRYATGGTMTCDFAIVIYPAPNTSCPKLLSFCWSLNDIYLGDHPDFTPSGGTFSGNYITSNGNFDCENAGPGNHVITYHYTTDKNGCSDSCQTTISVVNGALENCPSNGIYVCYSEEINLASVANILPSPGTYTGQYVENNILKAPSPGTYQITYVYERIQGCDGICKFNITLHPVPSFQCPNDITICGTGGGLIALSYPQKYGWNYEGTGVYVSNGIPYFDPGKAGVGNHKITLTVYNDYQCSITCEYYITVTDFSVTCPRLLSFCWGLSSIYLGDLKDFSPQGGAFSGDYITSDGYFDNGNAGPGDHLITYTYTDPKTQCTDSCQTTISIVNGALENCPSNGIYTCYDSIIDLSKVAPIYPTGGMYSGNYVTNNILKAPSPGTYEIIYIYERSQGCDGICKFNITLYPIPKFECPDDMLLCGSENPIILPYPKDYGWNYEGTGVYVTNRIPYFDPQKAGPGKHKITLTIYNDYQCEVVCVYYITVGNISVECPKMLEVCANEKTDLKKRWNFNPLGTFSGDMVDASGIFTAPVVYEKKCVTLKYVLKDESGCGDSCEFVVCILPFPRIECPDTIETCLGDTTLVLIPNAPGHFYWKDTQIPNPLDPAKLGAGTYNITYTQVISENPYCVYTCNFVLIIYPKPVYECPHDTVVCLSDELIKLPVPDFPKWNYEGKGVYVVDGIPVFNPAKAGVGEFTITITVVDKNGCTATCRFTITVVDYHISCPKIVWVCPGIKTDLKNRWNFDPRGKFTGDFVSTDGIFDAPMIDYQKCFEITYRSTSEASCKDSCTFSVCILPPPEFECPDTVYRCIDGGVYLPPLASNYKFYWNDKEIPNGFNPVEAGVGTHPMKVIYWAPNELKCEYVCEFVIVVSPKSTFECPKDMSLCSVDEIITLPLLPYPKYSYRGTGIYSQGNISYFSAPKPGEYTITVSITDRYGCTGTCTFTITVGEFNLECPKVLKVCPDVKTDLTKLWNFDPRGEFFGEWVTSDGIFNAPYIPGKNNCYTLMYKLKIDENCKDSCRFVVCVNYVPEVKCPDTLEVCIDDRPFNPAAGSSATVYFNGHPIPNGFNPAEAGAGTHILTFEYPTTQSDCKAYCQMVVIVHPLPEIDCPDDIYLCNPKTERALPVFDYPYFEYRGKGIFYKERKPYFRAPNGRPGTYTIWLYVKDKFGCTNSCSFNIVVGNINISCPEYLTVCPGATTDLTTLWNFHPHGTFSGPFVNAGGLFDAPEVIGETECYPIQFTIKTDDGCVDSCTFKVCVLALPKIQCPDTIHVCINDSTFDPMPGAPGIIYYNDQPIPNGFNPQTAGVGTHHLHYHYLISRKPYCEYDCDFVIVVHALPKIECPNNMMICSTDQKIKLPAQPYYQYVYSGDGVTNESGAYYFNSSTAGTGQHVIMLVVYDQYGCKSLCRFIIYVGDTKIDCPDTLWVCRNEKGNLNRLWNFPYDGTFSGIGVYPDGAYSGEVIAEKQCVDVYYHYYKYKCEDSCLFTICTELLPNVDCPDTIHTCVNGIPFMPMDSVTGTFYFKGEPLPNGYFNPMAYSEGTYTITYVETYGHNRDCKYTCDIIVVIHPLPKLECPDDILICNSNVDKIELPVLPYPYYLYTGDHVTGDPGHQVFLVSEAGSGIHYISVTVKDQWGCSKTCRFRVIIGENTIDCPDTLYLCPGNKYPLTRITNLPGGGHFISDMVSNNWFYAPVSDVDKCYDIKYVLKDTLGCVDSCQFVICVQGKTEIDCPDTIKVCFNSDPFVPNVKPAGGKFYLADGSILPDGLFDPALFGVGNHIVYYYTTTASPYFCDIRCSFVIQVLPEPESPIYTHVLMFCQGDPVVLFPGYGTVSLNGKPITAFYPTTPGRYNLLATIKDRITGCSTTDELIFIVNPLPEVNCPKDVTVCAKKGIYELGGGEPAGGTYHENGKALTYIHTDSPGVHTIWYVYTDRYTGCTDSCSFKVYVLTPPQIDCPEKITVCSEDEVNLLGYVTKPASEMYHYWFSGPGLSGEHNEIFNAASMQQGEYLINYTVGVGDCVDSCSFWVVVYRPPMEINCPDDMFLCASSNAIDIWALLTPTGAAPSGLIVTGPYLTTSATHAGVYFDPGKVDPKDYDKPLEFTARSCTYFNDRKDSCCTTCTFHITVTNHAQVECAGNIFACEGTGSIDLNNYVSPDGGEFYYNGTLIGNIFYLANIPSLRDIVITYFLPERGADCADSCTLTLKVLPKPVIDLRDTVCVDNNPFTINNNQVLYASSYHWSSDGTGYFDNPGVLHPTYHPNIEDFKTGKINFILIASNEKCEAKDSMSVSLAQKLEFPAGWGGVSLYRDPVEEDIMDIVGPIKDDLNLIFNLSGDNYIPTNSTLASWDNQTGYIANCTSGSSLLVAGSYNDGQPLYVSSGWNLIPVLSACSADADILNLNNNLIMVKEVAGLDVFWPEANVADLTELQPGKSYLADFTGSETIIFPSCESVLSSLLKNTTVDPYIPEGWGTLHKTPISMVVALPLDQFTGLDISDGDVIGAFTPEGILGGVCEIGLNNTLVIFGDDPLTNHKDGFANCDPVTLKLYKRSSGSIFSITPEVIEGSLECYKENETAKIGSVVLTDVNTVHQPQFLVYPNPVKQNMQVVNPVGSVTCTIFTLTGQAIMTRQLEHGINSLPVELLKGGVYIIQFCDRDYMVSKRFIKK